MSMPNWVAHGAMHSAGSMFGPLGTAVSYIANTAFPFEAPGIGEVIDLFNRGWLTDAGLQWAATLHGAYIPGGELGSDVGTDNNQQKLGRLWRAYVSAHEALPSPDEMLRLTNRGILPEDKLVYNLGRHGFHSEVTAKAFANLRYEVPPTADLVRFAVRHVFEPDLIAKLGYNDEYRPILDIFHQFQGLNYPIFTGPFQKSINKWEVSHGFRENNFLQQYIQFEVGDPTWAQAYWWSHWVLPSASQGYEMYFRLRPDRDRSFDPEFAQKLNFTLDDLNLLLRANDYPPHYRDYLAAIAFRIPGIRFMRELIRNGVYTTQQVYDLLRRQGYSDGDAQALTVNLAKSDRDARRKAIEQQAHGQFARYYELGILSNFEYANLLVKHGLSQEDANETVLLAETDRAAKKAQRVIAFVRTQFINGKVDRNQAVNLLSHAGVQEPQRGDFIDEWALEIKAKHREISASQAIRLACKGLITIEELALRLVNLEYSQDDVRVLSAEAVQCATERAAMLVAKAAKQERQRQSDILKAQQQLAKQQKTLQRQLASHGSPAQLRKWFCEGNIGEPEVIQRLQFLDWPLPDIQRLIADCRTGSGGKGKGTGGGGG